MRKYKIERMLLPSLTDYTADGRLRKQYVECLTHTAWGTRPLTRREMVLKVRCTWVRCLYIPAIDSAEKYMYIQRLFYFRAEL